jgi:hypothetical protein
MVNSEDLIPCRKKNSRGVLQIESELPQLSLNVYKQRNFIIMIITKRDKPSPTLI